MNIWVKYEFNRFRWTRSSKKALKIITSFWSKGYNLDLNMCPSFTQPPVLPMSLAILAQDRTYPNVIQVWTLEHWSRRLYHSTTMEILIYDLSLLSTIWTATLFCTTCLWQVDDNLLFIFWTITYFKFL